jgi:hypothetical protein
MVVIEAVDLTCTCDLSFFLYLRCKSMITNVRYCLDDSTGQSNELLCKGLLHHIRLELFA